MELEVKLLYEPVCPSVRRRLVGCLVCNNFLKGAGNFTSHALIGSLVYLFTSFVPVYHPFFFPFSTYLPPYYHVPSFLPVHLYTQITVTSALRSCASTGV